MSRSARAAEAVVQRFRSAPGDSGSKAPSLQQIARRLRDAPKGVTTLTGIDVVRRKTFAEMRTTLVNDSGHRKANHDYQSILLKLDAAAAKEPTAFGRLDLDALIAAIREVRDLLPSARSVTAERNAALDQLARDLDEREGELQEESRLSVAEPMPARRKAGGPMAGFEYEFSGVYVFNIEAGREPARHALKQWLASPTDRLPNFAGLAFKKRDTLFVAPNGTWSATADTSNQACSNLEFVTRPLSPREWNESEEVRDDLALLDRFVATLRAQRSRAALLPKRLAAEVLIKEGGARLLKVDDDALVGQTQMTRAVPLPIANRDAPAWWIPGLEWRVFPLLKSVLQAVNKRVSGDTNPKTVFGDKIIKSPIGDIIGTPRLPPTGAEREAWVIEVLRACAMTNVANQPLAGELVASAGSGNKPHFRLRPSKHTYRQYLEGLLEGNDLLTSWAGTAFLTGQEDIGLGNIDDGVPGGYVEEDRRSHRDVGPQQFRATALDWARSNNYT